VKTEEPPAEVTSRGGQGPGYPNLSWLDRLLSHFDAPTYDEWVLILGQFPELRDLCIDAQPNPNLGGALSLLCSDDFPIRLMQFNNRLFEVRMAFVIAEHFRHKGIPDAEWHVTGPRGAGVTFLPHLSEDQESIKTLFDFNVDVLFHKCFGAWDGLFQVINSYYQYGFDNGPALAKKVKQRLRQRDRGVFDIVRTAEKHDDFVKARKLRNDLTHNYSPSEVYCGARAIRDPSGEIRTIVSGVANYTPSAELCDAVRRLILLFSNTLKALEQEWAGHHAMSLSDTEAAQGPAQGQDRPGQDRHRAADCGDGQAD